MWKQKNNADNSCTFTDFNPQRPEYISNITGNPRTFVDNNNPLSNASINIITDNSKDFNPDVKNNKAENNKEN